MIKRLAPWLCLLAMPALAGGIVPAQPQHAPTAGQALPNTNPAADTSTPPPTPAPPNAAQTTGAAAARPDAGAAPPTGETPKPAGGGRLPPREVKDPTNMSSRFQQAMKQMVPSGGGGRGGANADKLSIPKLHLAGKSLGGRNGGSAMIQIQDGTPFLVRLGSQFTIMSSSGETLTVRVDSIDQSGVQLVILPHNRRIFIN